MTDQDNQPLTPDPPLPSHVPEAPDIDVQHRAPEEESVGEPEEEDSAPRKPSEVQGRAPEEGTASELEGEDSPTQEPPD